MGKSIRSGIATIVVVLGSLTSLYSQPISKPRFDAEEVKTNKLRVKAGPVFDVTAWGAVGNGVADDTAEIQAAIDAAAAVQSYPGSNNKSGSVVFFPTGTYLISAPLVLPRADNTTHPRAVWLIGADKHATVIQGTSGFATGQGLIEWSALAFRAWDNRIERLTLIAPPVDNTYAIYFTPTNTSTWIQINAQRFNLTLEDVEIEGSNEFHRALVRIRGICNTCSFVRVNADPAINTRTYDTMAFQFDDTPLSGSGQANAFDDAGCNWCKFDSIWTTPQRGGYCGVVKGRLAYGTFTAVEDGNGNFNDPVIDLNNSIGVTFNGMTLEGRGEKPQIKVTDSRYIHFRQLSLGHPNDAGGGIGNGIEFYSVTDSSIERVGDDWGFVSFDDQGVKLAVIDANSARNTFEIGLRAGTNGAAAEITDNGTNNHWTIVDHEGATTTLLGTKSFANVAASTVTTRSTSGTAAIRQVAGVTDNSTAVDAAETAFGSDPGVLIIAPDSTATDKPALWNRANSRRLVLDYNKHGTIVSDSAWFSDVVNPFHTKRLGVYSWVDGDDYRDYINWDCVSLDTPYDCCTDYKTGTCTGADSRDVFRSVDFFLNQIGGGDNRYGFGDDKDRTINVSVGMRAGGTGEAMSIYSTIERFGEGDATAVAGDAECGGWGSDQGDEGCVALRAVRDESSNSVTGTTQTGTTGTSLVMFGLVTQETGEGQYVLRTDAFEGNSTECADGQEFGTRSSGCLSLDGDNATLKVNSAVAGTFNISTGSHALGTDLCGNAAGCAWTTSGRDGNGVGEEKYCLILDVDINNGQCATFPPQPGRCENALSLCTGAATPYSCCQGIGQGTCTTNQTDRCWSNAGCEATCTLPAADTCDLNPFGGRPDGPVPFYYPIKAIGPDGVSTSAIHVRSWSAGQDLGYTGFAKDWNTWQKDSVSIGMYADTDDAALACSISGQCAFKIVNCSQIWKISYPDPANSMDQSPTITADVRGYSSWTTNGGDTYFVPMVSTNFGSAATFLEQDITPQVSSRVESTVRIISNYSGAGTVKDNAMEIAGNYGWGIDLSGSRFSTGGIRIGAGWLDSPIGVQFDNYATFAAPGYRSGTRIRWNWRTLALAARSANIHAFAQSYRPTLGTETMGMATTISSGDGSENGLYLFHDDVDFTTVDDYQGDVRLCLGNLDCSQLWNLVLYERADSDATGNKGDEDNGLWILFGQGLTGVSKEALKVSSVFNSVTTDIFSVFLNANSTETNADDSAYLQVKSGVDFRGFSDTGSTQQWEIDTATGNYSKRMAATGALQRASMALFETTNCAGITVPSEVAYCRDTDLPSILYVSLPNTSGTWVWVQIAAAP